MWHQTIVFSVFVALSVARPQFQKGGFVPKKLGAVLSPTEAPLVKLTNVKEERPNYLPNEYERHQNEAARYKFNSNIDDKISDLTHQRSEERQGLAVKGMYSYSDGYYKRTVHYEADQNGYRVTSMEAVPLEGPNPDLTGSASVDSAAHGTHVTYRVQSVPVPGPVAKIITET